MLQSLKFSASPKSSPAKRVLQAAIFIYIFSVTFQNLKINSFDIGQYLKPIASIPFFLVFVADLLALYLIEKVEKKEEIRAGEVLRKTGRFAHSFGNQKVSSFFYHAVLGYFKRVMKQVLFAFLLIIPITIIFGFIQALLTGTFDTRTTFSF